MNVPGGGIPSGNSGACRGRARFATAWQGSAGHGKGPNGTPTRKDFRVEYEFKLTGRMPLLMHADDVLAADELTKWRKSAENKAISVAGDDRSPAWTWTRYLYSDGEHVTMPQENLMAALGKAGAAIPAAKGKGSFKAASQSGLYPSSEFFEFRTNDGRQVSMADIGSISGLTFSEQMAAVKKLGFDLLVKRATVGSSKHVRVRARFGGGWTVAGVIEVTDPIITAAVLEEMFSIAGKKVGLCDWRPGSPKKPGPFGTFRSEVKPLGAAKKSA